MTGHWFVSDHSNSTHIWDWWYLPYENGREFIPISYFWRFFLGGDDSEFLKKKCKRQERPSKRNSCRP